MLFENKLSSTVFELNLGIHHLKTVQLISIFTVEPCAEILQAQLSVFSSSIFSFHNFQKTKIVEF